MGGMPNTVVDSNGKMVNSNVEVNNPKPEPAKQIICGQLVTLKNLQNDLDFWMETDAFKNLFINKGGDVTTSYEFYSEGLILQKADVIRACFLEQRGKESFLIDNHGAVVTDSYINVPRDLCDATIMSINSGIIDNTIFMEASGYVFPILVHFWKIYREQYAKISYNKWIGLTDALKNRLKMERKRKTGFVKSQLMKKLHEHQLDEVKPPEFNYQKIDKSMGDTNKKDTSNNSDKQRINQSIYDSELQLPIVVSEIRNIKPLTPVPFNRFKRDLSARAANSATNQAGDYEAPKARITFSIQEGIVLHCTPRWQDTITGANIKKIKQPSQIKTASNKEHSNEKHKNNNHRTNSHQNHQNQKGGFKIVIEDDESQDNLKKDKKTNKNNNKDQTKTEKEKSKKNKNNNNKASNKESKTGKLTKEHEESGAISSLTSFSSTLSITDSKLTPDQRCKRVLRKKDKEHEAAFALAEKRLRGAIRGQIREKRRVNAPYPNYH